VAARRLLELVGDGGAAVRRRLVFDGRQVGPEIDFRGDVSYPLVRLVGLGAGLRARKTVPTHFALRSIGTVEHERRAISPGGCFPQDATRRTMSHGIASSSDDFAARL